MKKVLFVTYGAGHVRIAIPIIKKLQKQNFEIKVLGLTGSVKDLKKEKLDYNKIKDYLKLFNNNEMKLIEKFGNEVIDDSYDQDSNLDKEDIKAYLGLNLWNNYKQSGSFEQTLTDYYENGRQTFSPNRVMRKILEFEQPDMLVVTSSARAEKAAAQEANKINIPVIRIIDLVGGTDPIPYKAKVCVFNDMVKNHIIKYNPNLNEDDIFITGQPNLELNYNEEEYKEFKKNYKLESYDHVVSFFSRHRIDYIQELFKSKIDFAINNPQYFIIWKLHPNESFEEYKDYLNELPENLVVLRDYDPNVVLSHSTITGTFSSTVGALAINTGVPLYVINLSEIPHSVRYDEISDAILVDDLVNLPETIYTLVNQNRVNSKKMKNYNFENSPATKNITDLIQRFI